MKMTEIKDTVRSCNRHLCKRKDHSSSLGHRRQRAQPREERRGSPTERQMRVGPWWRGRVETAWQVMAAPRCIVERGHPSPSGQPAARRPPPAACDRPPKRPPPLRPSSSRTLHGYTSRDAPLVRRSFNHTAFLLFTQTASRALSSYICESSESIAFYNDFPFPCFLPFPDAVSGPHQQ